MVSPFYFGARIQIPTRVAHARQGATSRSGAALDGYGGLRVPACVERGLDLAADLDWQCLIRIAQMAHSDILRVVVEGDDDRVPWGNGGLLDLGDVRSALMPERCGDVRHAKPQALDGSVDGITAFDDHGGIALEQPDQARVTAAA